MGNSKSTLVEPSVAPPDNDRSKLFINIFERLLKETDIIDIQALTKGPGACGAYVVLLENRLNDEFQKIQLETATSGTKEVQHFLYTKTKDIVTESATDKNACRELANFYIRLLLLVATLTMSIYTPPDLIERVRQATLNKSLKNQQRNIPLSIEEKESLRIKKWEWLRTNILGDSQGSDIYILKNKPQFKYNNTTKILTYISNDEMLYEGKFAVEEMGTFPFDISYIKNDSYWITLTNPKDNTYIFRMLVNKDGSGYRFENKPRENDKEEKAIVFYKDWATDLASDMLRSLIGVKAYQKPKDLNYYYNPQRMIGYNRMMGGTRSKKHRNNKKLGGSNISRTNSESITRKNTKTTSTMPIKFQEIHKSIINWQSKFASWTDACPAAYRSILLYSKPNMAGLASASYFCVDTWTQKSMRNIPPFAALESLYFNRDDGTASYSNKEKLRNLVEDFRNLYSVKPRNSTTNYEDFNDVLLPSIPEKLNSELCKLQTAYGDISPENKYSEILQVAQTKILDEFKRHFEDAYNILSMLFDLNTKNKKGELIIKFSTSFITNSKGARAALEDIIDIARSKIGYHYYQVESIYIKALKDVFTAMR
jgi:hypothetical protein